MRTELSASRLFALLLLCVALLCLCSCGEQAPEAGRYVLAELYSGAIPLETADSTLRLDTGGRGELFFEGESGGLTWRSNGSDVYLNFNGAAFSAQLRDGILSFRTQEDLRFVYVREDLADVYLTRLTEEREHRLALQELWLGDWYGWWRIEQSEGRLADTWYDLCARFYLQDDGELYLSLWDEDQSADDPMAEVRLALSENGTAYPAEGYFWFDQPDADWILGQTDGCIRLAARHEADGESFDYVLCLRRWGDRWDGAEQRPYYYDDWYLPLLKAGKSMPERMTIKS